MSNSTLNRLGRLALIASFALSLAGLLIELPRGLAAAAIGYVLFTRGREEPSAASLPTGTEPVRSGAPAA